MKLVESIPAIPRDTAVLRQIKPGDPNYLSPKELSKKLRLSDDCMEQIRQYQKDRERWTPERERRYI